jgi:hypothetical protein
MIMGARFKNILPGKQRSELLIQYIHQIYHRWTFASSGYAREQTKYQIFTSEDDLEDKLTSVWETVSGDLHKSVFYEWI